jgi:hypothetical protein
LIKKGTAELVDGLFLPYKGQSYLSVSALFPDGSGTSGMLKLLALEVYTETVRVCVVCIWLESCVLDLDKPFFDSDGKRGELCCVVISLARWNPCHTMSVLLALDRGVMFSERSG